MNRSILIRDDEYYMKEALKEAYEALKEDEIPVGAVIECRGRIIAKAHNLSQKLNDFTAHAEMQAYTAAASFLGGKYLNECTLYVTLEPCMMCAGASYWTQIKRIVYGARDEKRGASSIDKRIYHPKTEVLSGVLKRECEDIIKEFFKKKRIDRL